MILLPGLTSTKKERIPKFIADLRRSDLRLIALFPTCLDKAERMVLYRELESIGGLGIPHVHLRSDCGEEEMEYLSLRFGTKAFNIHPRASIHPFGPLPEHFASSIFIENVDVPADDGELEGRGPCVPGGLCPDFSHLENARLQGRLDVYNTVISQLRRYPIGCCHISAVRPGVPNVWSGEWDHHEYASFNDLSYIKAYELYLPKDWASLELENSFDEQRAAIEYLEALLRDSSRRG